MAEPAEEWRPIPGYPGYLASSLGRIASLKSHHRRRPGQAYYILRPFNQDGYPRVHLCVGSKTRGQFLHRLTCLAFHGEPPEPKMHVAHCNGNRADARACNVRWASASENVADRKLHNFPHGRLRERGSARVFALAIRLAVLRDFQEGGLTKAEIARKYGMSHSCASRIIQRTPARLAKHARYEPTRLAVLETAMKEIEELTRDVPGDKQLLGQLVHRIRHLAMVCE
jgi:hypothetical protein